jgi:hypothetical protein
MMSEPGEGGYGDHCSGIPPPGAMATHMGSAAQCRPAGALRGAGPIFPPMWSCASAALPVLDPTAPGAWLTSEMDPRRAALSSISTTLDDLVDRIESAAKDADFHGDEGLAIDLFEVDRSLRRAQRRLSKVVRDGS